MVVSVSSVRIDGGGGAPRSNSGEVGRIFKGLISTLE